MRGLAKATLALIIALVLFGSTNLTAAGQRYRIALIGQEPALEPFQYVQSVGGLNNHGEVAFSYGRWIEITPTHSRGVSDSYVSTLAGIASIPDLGGDDAQASDLSDTGVVVGGASSADTYPSHFGELHYYEPFVSQGGQTNAIPTPERGFSYASAVNNLGEVVGSVSSQTSTTAFKWSESGGYENLGDFEAYYVNVIDINERSDILINVTPDETLQFGETYLYRGTQAVLYNAGSITHVPDSEFGLTYGSAINDHGVVVGSFGSIPGVESHAFVWDNRNGFRDLGIEGEFSYANDINNAGVVIGAYADAYQQPTTPFIYTEQAGRQRLIDLIDNLDGWTWLESATHINDRGQIVGIGRGSHGYSSRRIFLATPIPEPSTMTACLLFWVCIMTVSRQRVTRR